MPLKLYRRPGSDVWHFRGTVAGDRLRGSTKTTNREIAARIASEVEHRHHKRHLDGPAEVLTFPQAVALYLKAGKPSKYLTKIADYWKNARVKDMTAGAIRQSAIDIYPRANGATRTRQVIGPTRAVINHCAELDLCAPVRVKRFKSEAKVKKPVTVEWLEIFCAHARPMTAALAVFMFATACRISEARRVEWADIDFRQRRVLIRDSKTRRERFARIPDRVIVALANLPRDTKPFVSPETTLRRHWNEDIKRAAEAMPRFERLTFHCCRHGFATKMLRDGVDPKTAASLGGWANTSLFLDTYAHAIQDPSLTDGIFDTESDTKKQNQTKSKG
jgi:integrase